MIHSDTRFFGAFLIAQVGLDARVICRALELQKQSQPRIGELAAESGSIDSEELLQILNHQVDTYRRFGEIAVELGFLSPVQIDVLLSQQSQQRKRIGEILVEMGVMNEDEKDAHLKAYARWLEAASALGRATYVSVAK